MAHLQYMPGDPRLVDQLVYELKSKGIFDQFRKDCIADVDTRPAYQNLRQRVENSVSTFLARQCWQPDLNKNQLREKLRKHILDGNYLEQGVERIVDQVVNPKVATVFVPKVEDLVYNYLGITRKKTTFAETSNGNIDLLPTDLEAVSPGSVKSNDGKNESMEVDDCYQAVKMDVDEDTKEKLKEDSSAVTENNDKEKFEEAETSRISELTVHDSDGSDDRESIPLPSEEIRPEDIPPPENSPPKVELEKIELPKEPDVATDIPLPDEIPKEENEIFFKPINTDDDDSSSDSSLRRNMSPLTPIRNYNNENSCDAQQGFENEFAGTKEEEIKEPSSFRFAIEAKSAENSLDNSKADKKEAELSYQLNQVNINNINNFNTPGYEDSSNSHNLQIDYESDANSKIINESKVEPDQNSEDTKKSKRAEEKKSSYKSSHRSRDSHKHSSSRDKKSDSKPSSSRDSSRHDKKSSKDESKHKSSDKERSRDRSNKKDSKDSSKHRSSNKSSHKDSKSHRSSSSTHRSSNKHSDEKKSFSSNHKEKERSSDKTSSKEGSKEKSKDSKSSSHRSDKERKGSSSSSSSKSKSSEKDKDKKKKDDKDDHYSLSGRGNPNRRSTDRDSNDGSSSSKGSHRQSSTKSSESKKDSKESTSKSDNTSGSRSTSPSDKDNVVHDMGTNVSTLQNKPIRVETHLETPVSSPPRLPFVPDITLKKPKIAANFEEAKKIMKMRKFLEEEQRRMNQEAALLLEFQANVRPSLSQVYSSIPGPELEFACASNTSRTQYIIKSNENASETSLDNQDQPTYTNAELFNELNEGNKNDEIINDTSEKEPSEDNISTITKPVASNKEDVILNTIENAVVTIEATIEIIPDNTNTFESGDTVGNVCDKKCNEKHTESFVAPIVTEKSSAPKKYSSETQQKRNKVAESKKGNVNKTNPDLFYFTENEKLEAEVEKSKFSEFLKRYMEKASTSNKIHLINCDTYEENVLREASKTLGDFEIISYHKNGHLKAPIKKSIVKNINIVDEVSLPLDIQFEPSNDTDSVKSHVFSPGKSDCSFELSDYDAKLEEMVHKTSRREIMEIILGDFVDDSLTKMPKIDYITESNIDSSIDNDLKRKLDDVETTENNNRRVLTPNKIRKISTSDLITSTTQDETQCNTRITTARSKYLGRAKRVGLSRPKRPELPNSPSSDKSVENYEQNSQSTPKTPNGKVKAPRNIVQRYETADLYKPKLHYLSRRNVS